MKKNMQQNNNKKPQNKIVTKQEKKKIPNKQDKSRSNQLSPQKRKLNYKKDPYKIRLRNWITAMVIAIVTVISYQNAFHNNITNFDDNLYITDNPFIKDLSSETVKTLFADQYFFMGNYHPLSMLSLAIDYHFLKDDIAAYNKALVFEPQVAKDNPLTYFPLHFTNILLHMLSTILLFWFIYLTIKYWDTQNQKTKSWSFEIAAITAILFGVHTIHLESVAWISERKDVLYTFFFIGSLIAYVKYISLKKTSFYILSIFLFVLSLMSKGQAVSLAITLVAIDFLFNRKLLSKKVIIEKAPFLILAIIFGVVAIFAQQSSKSIATGAQWSAFERVIFASYGFVQYLFKLVAPINLSVFYPYPHAVSGSLPSHYYVYPVFAILAIVGFVFAVKKSRRIAFGILFFVINIFLVLQLLPVGKAVMADRYAYIASIGFFLLIGVLFSIVAEKTKGIPFVKYIMIGILALYVGFLGYKTQTRSFLWGSSLALWNDVIEQFPDSELAFNNRGDILSNQNKHQEALADFNRAIELDPNYDQTFYNRGVVIAKLAQMEGNKEVGNKKRLDAIKDFDKAIELNPKYHQAYSNRGATKFELGDKSSALSDFDKAISIKPDYIIAYSNRASAKAMLGNNKGAIEDFTASLKMQPTNGKIHHMRGLTYFKIGIYKLTAESFANFHKIGIPANVYNKFKPMQNKSFETQNDFIKALNKYIPNIHKSNIIQYLIQYSFVSTQKDNGCADFQKAVMLGFTSSKAEIEKRCK